MNFTGSNKELLLIHKEMKQARPEESVNVMLSPLFYTLKKEALPLKYAYQAKRIAPSLFDGLLEAGKQYDYMVWKEKEEWVFLAYDLEMIMAFLESKGFTLENVSKIFFAQQALDLFDKPLLLGENEALVVLDEVVVLVPRSALINEEPSLVFDNSFTPKKGVMIQGAYGSILSLRQALMLASIFTLFAIMFFIEGLRYSNNAKIGEEEMEKLLEANPSLQSKYTRESIAARYKTLDTAERKKREIVKAVSSMIFKGVTLTSLEIDDKKFKVHFSCKDAEIANRVKELAKKHKMNTSALSGTNDLKIEGTL
ncbi:hypothetical protein [Sulfurovum sp.]|uniref:hypothetical protein n=1 Tax=Sulfurovum sp. TaxID=1969726 RepID=UPI00286810B7|nr:hypothetical protein [Sulfurovum sp.]